MAQYVLKSWLNMNMAQYHQISGSKCVWHPKFPGFWVMSGSIPVQFMILHEPSDLLAISQGFSDSEGPQSHPIGQSLKNRDRHPKDGVYPEKPNGFADHYPYETWLFHGGIPMYTPFSDILILRWFFEAEHSPTVLSVFFIPTSHVPTMFSHLSVGLFKLLVGLIEVLFVLRNHCLQKGRAAKNKGDTMSVPSNLRMSTSMEGYTKQNMRKGIHKRKFTEFVGLQPCRPKKHFSTSEFAEKCLDGVL